MLVLYLFYCMVLFTLLIHNISTYCLIRYLILKYDMDIVISLLI